MARRRKGGTVQRGKYVLILLFLGLSISFAEWESIGPEGGQVKNIVQSYTDGDVLYATSGTSPTLVLKSVNSGDSWSVAGSFSWSNYCMTIGPTDNLYVGSANRIYRSSNGGASWTYSTFSNLYVYDIVAHPTDPSVIYGCGYKYTGSFWVIAFVKSSNGGTSWTETQLETVQSYGRCIAVSPSSPNTVYVGGYSFPSPYTPKLFKSTDGGTSFTDISWSGWAGQYYVYSLAVHPTNPDVLCAGLYYDIWRSTNGGTTWTEVTTNYYYNYDMAWSAANPDIVYSAAYNSIYRSLNGGLTWTSSSSGLDGTSFMTVAADRTSSTNAFTGNNYGFFKSETTGSSWVESNEGLIIGKVLAMGDTPGNPSRIFMQIEDVGVFLTTNDGDSWTRLGTPLSCGDFCSIVVHPTNPNTVLALEGAG